MSEAWTAAAARRAGRSSSRAQRSTARQSADGSSSASAVSSSAARGWAVSTSASVRSSTAQVPAGVQERLGGGGHGEPDRQAPGGGQRALVGEPAAQQRLDGPGVGGQPAGDGVQIAFGAVRAGGAVGGQEAAQEIDPVVLGQPDPAPEPRAEFGVGSQRRRAAARQGTPGDPSGEHPQHPEAGPGVGHPEQALPEQVRRPPGRVGEPLLRAGSGRQTVHRLDQVRHPVGQRGVSLAPLQQEHRLDHGADAVARHRKVAGLRPGPAGPVPASSGPRPRASGGPGSAAPRPGRGARPAPSRRAPRGAKRYPAPAGTSRPSVSTAEAQPVRQGKSSSKAARSSSPCPGPEAAPGRLVDLAGHLRRQPADRRAPEPGFGLGPDPYGDPEAGQVQMGGEDLLRAGPAGYVRGQRGPHLGEQAQGEGVPVVARRDGAGRDAVPLRRPLGLFRGEVAEPHGGRQASGGPLRAVQGPGG